MSIASDLEIYLLYMIAVGLGLAMLLGFVTLALLLLIECASAAVGKTWKVWRCVYAYLIHKDEVANAERWMRAHLLREMQEAAREPEAREGEG